MILILIKNKAFGVSRRYHCFNKIKKILGLAMNVDICETFQTKEFSLNSDNY